MAISEEERSLELRLEAAVAMRDAYSRQLDEIGAILVRANILTPEQIYRHGVAFAVAERYEPLTTAEPAEPEVL